MEKVLSNLQEVRARGGELFLFSDKRVKIDLDNYQSLTLDDICPTTAPIVYTVPLQLLSYYVALLKGTDVISQGTWQSRLRWSDFPVV